MATGVTPSGTAWTTFSAAVPSAGTVRWGMPTALIGTTGVPLMLYTHGANGGSNQFEELDAWVGIRNYLLDSGCAWVEGTGGGLQPWGNAESQTAYEIAYQHVAAILVPAISFGLFRSMGGIVGQWLLTKSTVLSGALGGAMINSGVQDLMWAYDSDNWTDAMNSAYGVTSRSQLEALAPSHDPMMFTPSLWTGKKLLQLVGTNDTLVPPESNAHPMRARYAGWPASDGLDVRQGGDHSSTNGSYLQTAAMAAFVDSMLGITPPDRVFYDVRGWSTLVGSTWFPVSFVA